MKTIDRLELLLSLAVPLAGLAVAACGGARGADPDDIQAGLDEVIVPLVDDSTAAFQFIDDSSALADMNGAMGGVRIGAAWGEQEGASDIEPDPEEEQVDPNEPTPGEEIARFLREVIFTEDNYEGDGVYRIRGRDVCPEEVSISEDGEAEPAPEGSQDCEKMIDDMELRIEVLVVDGGFDATLMIGPERSKPVKLESRDDRITVISDLGAAKDAIEHVASVTGEDIEMPERLEGVVAATLQRDGDAAATVSFAIREDVAVEASTESGDVSFEAAASDPVARLSVDAIARHLEVEANMGPVLASLPWSMFESETEIEGTLHVDLAGANGTIVVDDDDAAVTLTGVGLGDATSRISLDDQTLFAIDVNADEGRSFDLTVTPAEGRATMAFEPGVHVVTTIDTRPVTESWEEIDPAADGDTYEIELSGEHPTLEAIEGDETHDGALKVVAGRLSLSATGVEPVVVEAGECLLETEVVDGEARGFEDMSSGACPQ